MFFISCLTCDNVILNCFLFVRCILSCPKFLFADFSVNIGIAYDGNHVYAHVEGFGKTCQKKTKDTFINHIKPGSHLIHDKEKSHKILIKELKLSDESYDTNKLKKCKDKDNPLNPINRQCYLLKRFLRSHPGFSRDDIQHYINLYCFISNPPADRLEKVEMVLNSAIHLTKSLRYRDFYASKSR